MAEKDNPEKAGKGGLVPTLAVALLVSVAAVGIGWAMAGQIRTAMSGSQAPMIGTKADETESLRKEREGKNTVAEADDHGDASGFSLWSSNNAVRLEPIVSNLGAGASDWIRIEVGLLLGPGESITSDSEKMVITEQIVSLLRRSSVEDLSGASSFLQFREDLNDTVRLATNGRASEVRILSLVVE